MYDVFPHNLEIFVNTKKSNPIEGFSFNLFIVFFLQFKLCIGFRETKQHLGKRSTFENAEQKGH